MIEIEKTDNYIISRLNSEAPFTVTGHCTFYTKLTCKTGGHYKIVEYISVDESIKSLSEIIKCDDRGLGLIPK